MPEKICMQSTSLSLHLEIERLLLGQLGHYSSMLHGSGSLSGQRVCLGKKVY
jgi:hypothetical protein